MERAKPSKEALTPEQRERVRVCCDKYGAVAVAIRWGIALDTLGRASIGFEVNAGTRSLVERGLAGEVK